MSRTRALTIELPEEMADMIAEKVRSGEYQSESDVVVDGLLSLVLDDGPHQAEIDRWIETEMVPMLEAIDADPSLLIPLEEARRQLHAYIDHLDDKIR
ncbi:ribbon-helix-helix domain-containing protein [Rhizobium sp. C1]|uniref:ribbon-helix-helix domain-containing protein n=1 Tax=Rhizobium sp. C1 TaxID=1349799 RepID=UPI001E333387|nr:type II toxin-antitoxin system ParD family antitoxin [Rhizobium sp. C1]MCD2177019.1 type II toxin-antitoxin system ParD family antitoxin [Rhizobium sp. C1]